MPHRLWLLASAVLVLIFALAPSLPVAAGSAAVPPSQDSTPLPDGPLVVRVYYDDPAQISELQAYDLFEFNNRKERYVLVAVDAAALLTLKASGWRVVIDSKETAAFNQRLDPLPGQEAGIPGYPCYRTVEETYLTAETIVAAYPQLAQWIDVGDSWEKVTPGGQPGYDMMVLKLTNSAVPGPKPKLFLTTSIHAREYTPAELATRFAELLVSGYGIDPDITWILDHHEVHLMLQANPDGRKKAETGLSWRKNTNEAYCSPTSNNRGADLNRNFAFQWGCCGGSSTSPCDLTYRGPSPASEPEVQAVQNYLRAIYPDQRPDPLTSPAPADATGVYLDIHSYSQLVLWSWGFTSAVAPNGPALQTLGRKFAYFNNYTPQQAIGLYPTDGSTDDFGYGDLGVASYTFELGTAFFQSCSSFESTILPGNMPALLYAAKVVRTPYLTPAGPDALNVAAAPATITVGAPVVLTAAINDTRFNNSNGAEPSQAIAAAEYYIDTPPWQPGAVAYPMAAVDGNFNSTVENVTAVINSGCLTPGRHMLFVRGKDANGNWGAISAAFLQVQAPASPDYTLCAQPAAQVACAPADAQIAVDVRPWSGFAGPVTLSVSGAPVGATTSFSANPVTAPGSSTLIVGNTAGATPGSYTLTLSGTGTPGVRTSTAQMTLFPGSPAAPALTAPADGATLVSVAPQFAWNPAPYSSSYSLQIAADPAFNNIVASASGLLDATYTLPTELNSNTLYHWRVLAENQCGASLYSPAFSFTTAPAPGDCTLGTLPNALLAESFEGGANGWTSSGTANTWALWTSNVHDGQYAFHAAGSASVSDQRLVSPAIALPAGENPLSLKFWNRQVMEPRSGGCYDGGILEVSTNGGSAWSQILDANLLTDPYDGPISASYSNPLANLRAWCGNPQDWLNSIVDVSAYAGQTVQFRFRLGTDSGVGAEGWTIDQVVVQSCEAPCAYDVNGDGSVDIVDVQLVAGAFGTNVPAYDFNDNDIVDVFDIQTIAERWQIGC
jgi:murein tripeptide amidase MpaA